MQLVDQGKKAMIRLEDNNQMHIRTPVCAYRMHACDCEDITMDIVMRGVDACMQACTGGHSRTYARILIVLACWQIINAAV